MNRIHIVDELRGLCVVLMVIYHALYTLAASFLSPLALSLYTFFYPVEPFFAGVFIVLCGFSCRLSHNNVRRGLLLALVSAGLTTVLLLAMPSQVIRFGVLHCLAVCILLFAAAKPLLDRIPPLVGMIAAIVLFAVSWTVPTMHGGRFLGMALPAALLECDPLLPLGFGTVFSADYFPLIPWLFLFLCGTFLGHWRDRLPAWCYRRRIPPLSYLGRHSLWIYLLHQPIIFGAAWLITRL